VNHCYACHAADTKPLQVCGWIPRLDTVRRRHPRAAIIPGNTGKKPVAAANTADGPEAPHAQGQRALSKEEIASITAWIKQGAALPDQTEKLQPLSAKLSHTYATLKAEHWAFKPLTQPRCRQCEYRMAIG